MTDDLVKRLRVNRANLQMWLGEHLLEQYEKERTEAADRIEKLEAANLKQSCIKVDDQMRIEKLEAALRIVINWDSTLESEDGLDWGEVMDIASKALEGKDD